MNFNKEVIEKAKQAKSIDEMLVLAKESGIELTEEQAKEYFSQLNPHYGELADEELDNVAGGGCYSKDGYLMVAGFMYSCDFWQCSVCHTSERVKKVFEEKSCKYYHYDIFCRSCSFFDGCNCTNPKNRRE